MTTQIKVNWFQDVVEDHVNKTIINYYMENRMETNLNNFKIKLINLS